jgi:hypothetical protein
MSSAEQVFHFPKEVPEHRADSFSNMQPYAGNALVRAIEEGHHAWIKRDFWGNLSFDVISDTSFDAEGKPVHYRLSAEGREVGGEWLTYFSCDCKSGQNRTHLPVPCKHATLVGRRMVREGICVEVGTCFAPHPDLRTGELNFARVDSTGVEADGCEA